MSTRPLSGAFPPIPETGAVRESASSAGAGGKTGIRIENITKRFGPLKAVDNVSLDVAAGEFLTLLGPSGCGKTTLLRIIAGFAKPASGEISILDQRVTLLPPRLREIGFVFQSYALFPTKTVAENIAFGPRLRHWSKRKTDSRLDELCALTHLAGLQHRYPHELSGGQQQRVALARALALEPSILLLDEPLSALDARIRASLRTEIRSIVKRLHTTTIYVTHDQEEALAISDRVAVMNEGQLEQVGTPVEVYLHPRTRFVADFIGTTNWLPVVAVDRDHGTVLGETLPIRFPTAASNAHDSSYLSVRPEHIAIAPTGSDGNGGDNASNERPPGERVFSGRIVDHSFFGQHVRVVIDPHRELFVTADVPASDWIRHGFRTGDSISWQVQTEYAVLFQNGSVAAR